MQRCKKMKGHSHQLRARGESFQRSKITREPPAPFGNPCEAIATESSAWLLSKNIVPSATCAFS